MLPAVRDGRQSGGSDRSPAAAPFLHAGSAAVRRKEARMRRRTLLAGLAAAGKARAETVRDWPSRPVRVLVGFPAGGATDLYARMVATRLAALGQPVVVENRPAAGGVLANEAVARSTDGHTLLFASSSLTTGAALRAGQIPYDVLRDFAPVSLFASVANGILVHPSVPARTIEEFVALAKAQPRSLTMASPGNGTTAHVTQEYFKLRTGTAIEHVPYRGTGALLPDLLAGQVSSALDNLPPYVEHVQAGRLRLLAVTTARPWPTMPDAPTLSATVAPGFDVATWFGLVAPSATPVPVLAAIHQVCSEMLAEPAVIDRIRQGGAEPQGGPRAAFGDLLRQELERWTEVVRLTGTRAD
jgi:tripartite-type tricarboxylate transporter receptor subunit TctC